LLLQSLVQVCLLQPFPINLEVFHLSFTAISMSQLICLACVEISSKIQRSIFLRTSHLKKSCYRSEVSVCWVQTMLPIGILESKGSLQNSLYLKGLLLLSFEIAKSFCIKRKITFFAVLFSRLSMQKRRAKKRNRNFPKQG